MVQDVQQLRGSPNAAIALPAPLKIAATANAKLVLRASTRMIQMRKYAKIVVPGNTNPISKKPLVFHAFQEDTMIRLDKLTVPDVW